MAGESGLGPEIVLETERLLLRPWRVAEAVIQRELWTERDARVPPHRRIDADGHPTVTELEDSIRADRPSSTGLLAVERKDEGDVIGYCGLVESGRGPAGEPELAFELFRRVWGQGYATEASWAVLDWARSSGYQRLWATVWEWNTASRRVLGKIGFTHGWTDQGPDGNACLVLRRSVDPSGSEPPGLLIAKAARVRRTD